MTTLEKIASGQTKAIKTMTEREKQIQDLNTRGYYWNLKTQTK